MFKVHDQLTPEQVDKGLKAIVRDGMTAQAMVTLTGGAFLVAYAIELGASNVVIGMLAAIGPLAQLLQLPATWLVEKVRNRRAITLVAAGLSRLCWLPVALTPLLFSKSLGLTVLLGAIMTASALGAVSACSWNSWMRDLVPQDSMGRFFAGRLRKAMVVGIILSMAAAAYLDFWGKQWPARTLEGYSILFGLGFLAGMLGMLLLAQIPEPRMVVSDTRESLLRMLARPFRDQNFRRLMFFLCSWSFALNLAGPFFMVYMLRRLELAMSVVIGLSVLSQIMTFLFLRIWGAFTDHYSNKSVLKVCGPLLIISILAWTFTTMPERHTFTIPLLAGIHMVMGIASAGLALATGNIGLKLAPQGQATAYLATNTIMSSIAAGAAPILGGKLADFFAGRQVLWELQYHGPEGTITLPTLDLQQWDFFFVLAFLIGLYSLYRLTKVKEVGEVSQQVVLRELMTQVRHQVRTLSPVTAVRYAVNFPLMMATRISDRKEQRNVSSDQTDQG